MYRINDESDESEDLFEQDEGAQESSKKSESQRSFLKRSSTQDFIDEQYRNQADEQPIIFDSHFRKIDKIKELNDKKYVHPQYTLEDKIKFLQKHAPIDREIADLQAGQITMYEEGHLHPSRKQAIVNLFNQHLNDDKTLKYLVKKVDKIIEGELRASQTVSAKQTGENGSMDHRNLSAIQQTEHSLMVK